MISTKEKDSSTRIQILQDAIGEALRQGSSFSLWKTPGIDQNHLIVCSRPLEVEDFVLEEGSAGFAFSTFAPDGKKLFFPAETHYQFDSETQTHGPQETPASNDTSKLNHKPASLRFHYVSR